MFMEPDRDKVIRALLRLRAEVCCYSRDPCDCKFGIGTTEPPNEEQTGCPELAQAALVLSALEPAEWDRLWRAAQVASRVPAPLGGINGTLTQANLEARLAEHEARARRGRRTRPDTHPTIAREEPPPGAPAYGAWHWRCSLCGSYWLTNVERCNVGEVRCPGIRPPVDALGAAHTRTIQADRDHLHTRLREANDEVERLRNNLKVVRSERNALRERAEAAEIQVARLTVVPHHRDLDHLHTRLREAALAERAAAAQFLRDRASQYAHPTHLHVADLLRAFALLIQDGRHLDADHAQEIPNPQPDHTSTTSQNDQLLLDLRSIVLSLALHAAMSDDARNGTPPILLDNARDTLLRLASLPPGEASPDTWHSRRRLADSAIIHRPK